MAEIFTVETRGIGKPDYSKNVSSAIERRGLRLEYHQTLVIVGLVFSAIPSAYAWVQPPLAPGVTAHLMDNMTGVVLPLTVPQGYTLEMITAGGAFTEDVMLWAYLDGFLVTNMGIAVSGLPYYENQIVSLSTALRDPDGDFLHPVDVTLTNMGAGALQGGVQLVGILEAVGTPELPPVKTVRCKWCGHQHSVPNETTDIICPKCGKLFIVYTLGKVKKVG